MRFLSTKKEMLDYYKKLSKNTTLGFVPTMGALHDGHLSLVQKSIVDNDITVVSIFVNPTQFDNSKDLEKYPNLIEKDRELLEKQGVDVLFFPSEEDMYPNGKELENIDLGGLDREMEGEFRQNHFAGVATVVKRLFETVKPTSSYFGEKDFQQLQIIRKMVEVCNFSITIVGMPIIREKNGLAMSSRNLRLTQEQKEDASIIYNTLLLLKDNVKNATPKELQKIATEQFKASNLQLEYCIIADIDTLREVTKFEENKKYRCFMAAYCGKIRLIDNIELL